MRTYSKPLFEKDGLAVVEVCETDTTGAKAVIGYAILNPDGTELKFFETYEAALARLQELTDDKEPSTDYEP